MAVDQETAPLPGTVLAPDELLPDVAFTDAQSGEEWRPSELRQRSALILCFLHADCEPCHRLLTALRDRQDDIDWADAQVRVVLPEPEDGPFPVLLDPEDRARGRILGPDAQIPTLLVADRYTAVMESHTAPDHDFPEPEEVISRIVLLACECE